MVNLENINNSQLLFSEYIWQILMTLSFFLIWNNYKGKAFGIIPVKAFWIFISFIAGMAFYFNWD